MSITIKNTEDITKMRIAGKLASEVLDYITEFVKPGISTDEIDKLCHEFMVKEQWNLRETLLEKYPALDDHTKHYSMRCVSEEGAIEIYKNLKNKGQNI